MVFVVCCAGMAEGLGASIESLVGQSHLRDLLIQCCQVCLMPCIGTLSHALYGCQLLRLCSACVCGTLAACHTQHAMSMLDSQL